MAQVIGMWRMEIWINKIALVPGSLDGSSSHQLYSPWCIVRRTDHVCNILVNQLRHQAKMTASYHVMYRAEDTLNEELFQKK